MNEEEDVEIINRKKRKKKIIIIALIIIFILLTLVCTVIGYYLSIKNKIYSEYRPTTPPVILNSSGEEETVDYQQVPGITNVLLIGTDARTLEENSRADSIIIATLDNNNKKIKLTSLFRDTLVDIPGYGERKINAAMELGGKDLLIDTIRSNYNIHLDKYVIINFGGFEAVIDEIGGLELDVTEDLIYELNKYIGESTGGNDCPVQEAGLQVLNGKQALSYARIRYNVGDDYARTSRQREVIIKLAEKLKETNPIKYLGIMNKLVEHINTNIDLGDALDLAYTIYKLPSLNTEQLQIPVTNLAVTMNYRELGSVFITDLEQNGKIIYDFIYNDKITEEDEYDYYSLFSIVDGYEELQRQYDIINGNIIFESPIEKEDKEENQTNDNSNLENNNEVDEENNDNMGNINNEDEDNKEDTDDTNQELENEIENEIDNEENSNIDMPHEDATIPYFLFD